MRNQKMPTSSELHELQSILQERSHRKAVQRAVEVIVELVPQCSVTLLAISTHGRFTIDAWANIATSVIRSAERSFNREGLPKNLAEVVRAKAPSLIEDLASYQDWRESVPSVSSWAGFPILMHGRVIAIVNVQTNQQRITPEMVSAIEPIVSTVALIIVRYQEAAELAASVRQQKVLYRMALDGIRRQDVRDMLTRTMQLIGSLLASKHIDILLYDAERKKLVLEATRGHQTKRVGIEMDAESQHGVTVRAFQTQKPVIVKDTRGYAEFVEGGNTTRSELAIPLVVRGECVGVLNLESGRVGTFSQTDVRELAPFTAGLSLMIDNQQKTQQLHKRATHDALTGFLNRDVMNDLVPRELQRARRYHREMSLAMVDIDNFKEVNDTLGHQEGDRLLQAFANCIRKITRSSDVVFRYGGDEFLLILPETNRLQAEIVMKRIADADFPDLVTKIGKISFSAGISSCVDDAISSDLLKLADDRLYVSKRLGCGIVTSQ